MTAGGKRPGAGRKKKEPTTPIYFRVPKKWADEIRQEVKLIINKFKTK